MLSVMVGVVVVRLVPDDMTENGIPMNTSAINEMRVTVAASLTFLSGVVQVSKHVCLHVSVYE